MAPSTASGGGVVATGLPPPAAAPVVVVVEAGGSGLSTYSPISTLERQGYPTGSSLAAAAAGGGGGIGKRLYLFVKANRNCCVPGGVEGILKQRGQVGRTNSGGASSTGSSQLPPVAPGTAATTQGDVNGSAFGGGLDGDDPFSFLSCDGGSGDMDFFGGSSAAQGQQHQTAASGAGKRGAKNPMSFLKKVAKSTTQTLERGMHTLAIRADQGRNPDLVTVGVYGGGGGNGNALLLALTESQPLPSPTDGAEGIHFIVPLVVPGALAQQPNSGEDDVLTIKVWIRSGAALLQQAKAAKNFLVGQGQVHISDLRTSLQGGLRASYLNLSLQSSLVVDAKLSLCVVPDTKFPPICGRGWSLADPTFESYFATAAVPKPLYNLPLNQSYGFPYPPLGPAATLVATERTTESTVVLPIAAAVGKLTSEACAVSLRHSISAASVLQARRIDMQVGEYADVNVQIGSIQRSSTSSQHQHQQPLVSASLQRPDSVLEVELTQPQKLPPSPSADGNFVPAVSFRFFPKPCRTDVLPSLLQATGGRLPAAGFLLGNLHLQFTARSRSAASAAVPVVTPVNPFDDPLVSVMQQMPTSPVTEEVWDCVISLESLAQQQQQQGGTSQVQQFPVLDSKGQPVATVAMTITVQMQQATGSAVVPTAVPPARDGLVSLVGLSPLVPSVRPCLDYDADAMLIPASDPDAQRRQHQLYTMGMFVSHKYLEEHNRTIREADAKLLTERADSYKKTLAANSTATEDKLLPHQDRSPRPFRPSSSRSEVLLSGIPFNVHIASLSLNVMDPNNTDTKQEPLGGVFTNTTCGAPADHARGYGNVLKSMESASRPISGGLRRIELARQDLASTIVSLQTQLITAIASHFSMQRQAGRAPTHVPAGHPSIIPIQRKLYDAVQTFHHVTWICAMRRSSVFSQALGIAVTTFLSSLTEKWQTTWPSLWARHGYLLSFEGLLSAAGNELGMIEDASVGIAMLHRVSLVLVRDDGDRNRASRIAVPGSPYLKWIELSTSGQYDQRQFILQIGMVPSYYDQRVPAILQNCPIRIFSLLFEVGVDIRQWGAHAGSNMMTQFDRGQGDKSSASNGNEKSTEAPAGLIEDEDDDVGIQDDDVLVQLNSEAFRLLNTYAHLISPANSPATATAQKSTHPLLEKLYQHIVSSAGKIDHNILDEAASLAQQLGGGAAVFCKSGKDRTAMHSTFKQAQFAYRFREQTQPSTSGGDVAGGPSGGIIPAVLQDAAVLRVHGTRLPICEKNVGQAKYAFNSLQVQFMPDALKPPMNTLAGFLKGGKVFSGGGIES